MLLCLTKGVFRLSTSELLVLTAPGLRHLLQCSGGLVPRHEKKRAVLREVAQPRFQWVLMLAALVEVVFHLQLILH